MVVDNPLRQRVETKTRSRLVSWFMPNLVPLARCQALGPDVAAHHYLACQPVPVCRHRVVSSLISHKIRLSWSTYADELGAAVTTLGNGAALLDVQHTELTTWGTHGACGIRAGIPTGSMVSS